MTIRVGSLVFTATGCRRYCAKAMEQAEIEAVRRRAYLNAMKEHIYCGGSLLEAVQTSNMFTDCKHFVDMPLRFDAESTLINWETLRREIQGTVPFERLRQFVNEHFEDPEGELVECTPTDFDPKVDSFLKIKDDSYRLFAAALHSKWPSLYRRIADKVLTNPERYSLIQVPHPFIVPGGRFREMYYWDSFFTIRGLLVSKMFNTAKGMIENMQYLIELFGFVPNGNRVYYLNRSQPPVLTWMVHAYYKATGDENFVASMLPTLRKELAFFQNNRAIMLDDWIGPLFRYHCVATQPRPESFREDVESAECYPDVQDKHRLWGEIAAAAESGRDFSSRWFDQTGIRAQQMSSTRTSQLIPVDLNAIICGNVKMMGELYDVLGDVDSSKWCALFSDQLRRTIHQVLWREDKGCWFDYDLAVKDHADIFHDTNLFPLCCDATHENYDSTATANYLAASGVLNFPGGIPSSLIPTGQQWDFPNAWAPTSWVMIEGLRKCGEHNLAVTIAKKWVQKNYNMWKLSGGRMYEKYNVVSPCVTAAGGGGEYDVQEGFGWSNGVILDLLNTFAEDLRYEASSYTNII